MIEFQTILVYLLFVLAIAYLIYFFCKKKQRNSGGQGRCDKCSSKN